jgi:uncharacterized membrane protein
VGILSKGAPRLITTFRRVPPGTNGGVSLLGTLSSLAAGACIGGSFAAVAAAKHQVLEAAAAAGLGGGFGRSIQLRDHLWLQLRLPSGARLPQEATVLLLCVCAGALGSLLDSLLGATLQYSGFSEARKVVARPGPRVKRVSGLDLLSNNSVNAIAATSTAAVAGAACMLYATFAGPPM